MAIVRNRTGQRKGAPLRKEYLSRLRTVAPPNWQEALAAQPKSDQATEAGSNK